MGFTCQWRPQELFVLSSHQKCPDAGRGDGGGTKRREKGGRRKEEGGRRKEEEGGGWRRMEGRGKKVLCFLVW
jgi:hypothetical protein